MERGLIRALARSRKLLRVFSLCLTVLLIAAFLGWVSSRRMSFSYARAISLLLWVLYDGNPASSLINSTDVLAYCPVIALRHLFWVTSNWLNWLGDNQGCHPAAA